tara:strand:+ start:374 stop:571 length:198 start_codon:yes stop_codon:yes gene_type:complete
MGIFNSNNKEKTETKSNVSKPKERRKDNQEFIELVKSLKEIVVDHNQRISEVESLVKRIAQRMGL